MTRRQTVTLLLVVLALAVALLPLGIPTLIRTTKDFDQRAEAIAFEGVVSRTVSPASDTLRYSGPFVGSVVLGRRGIPDSAKIAVSGILDGSIVGWRSSSVRASSPPDDSVSIASKEWLSYKLRSYTYPHVSQALEEQGICDPISVKGRFSGHIRGSQTRINTAFITVPLLVLFFLLVILPLTIGMARRWKNLKSLGYVFLAGFPVNLLLIILRIPDLRSARTLIVYSAGFFLIVFAMVGLPWFRRIMPHNDPVEDAKFHLFDKAISYMSSVCFLGMMLTISVGSAIALSGMSQALYLLPDRQCYLLTCAIMAFIFLPSCLIFVLSFMVVIPFLVLPVVAVDAAMSVGRSRLDRTLTPTWLTRLNQTESAFYMRSKPRKRVLQIVVALFVASAVAVMLMIAVRALVGTDLNVPTGLVGNLILTGIVGVEIAMLLVGAGHYRGLIRRGLITEKHLGEYSLFSALGLILLIVNAVGTLGFLYFWLSYGTPTFLIEFGLAGRDAFALVAGVDAVKTAFERMAPVLMNTVASFIVFGGFAFLMPYFFLLGAKPIAVAGACFVVSYGGGKLAGLVSKRIIWSGVSGVILSLAIAVVCYIVAKSLQSYLRRHVWKVGTCSNPDCSKQINLAWRVCPHCAELITQKPGRTIGLSAEGPG